MKGLGERGKHIKLTEMFYGPIQRIWMRQFDAMRDPQYLRQQVNLFNEGQIFHHRQVIL